MSTQYFVITHQNLQALLSGVIVGGAELYAPQKKGENLFVERVTSPDCIAFDPLPTVESPKSLLFPRAERLMAYERSDDGVRVDDPSAVQLPRRVLFGTRPCDAVALRRLADFFAAEIPDVFVARRRDALTIISMSCSEADADCFCTSMGTGPGDPAGSDILLTAAGNERFYLECLTENGLALLRGHDSLLEKAEALDKQPFLAKVKELQGVGQLQAQLGNAFNHPIWKEASLQCLGCGACAYVCPLCSCFDIEDEGSPARGERLRCWDSCGFSLFTLHTSGHNPRPTQSDRWRQRMMHKFAYMPERFGFSGCVGCGRCSRACPVDMNIKEQVTAMGAQIVGEGVQ